MWLWKVIKRAFGFYGGDEPDYSSRVDVYGGYAIEVKPGLARPSDPALQIYTAIARDTMHDAVPVELGGAPPMLTGIGYSPEQAVGDVKMAIKEMVPGAIDSALDN